MLVVILSSENDLAGTGQDIVRIFYPDARIVLEPVGNYDLALTVSASVNGNVLTGQASLKTLGSPVKEDTAIQRKLATGDVRNQLKWLVKLALFRILVRFTETSPGPWGILTGIRPTKIVHRLLDLSWEQPQIIEYLSDYYAMAVNKAVLLTQIASGQRPFLMPEEQAESTVSIYIGIPFCPTRCAYCSFPAYPVDKWGQLTDLFLDALQREIYKVGSVLKRQGIGVQAIYIGGGTPTTLNEYQLASLLKTVRQFLVSGITSEITLEAGRPDTISEDKLRIAVENGITRLSINPQSMKAETLKAIGRKHLPEDIVLTMNAARGYGFKTINMDIILGLPGESAEDVANTLREIRLLNPENLTVHTLAVKRTSQIKESSEEYSLPAGREVEKMLDLTAKIAGQMDMHPYYLYRQKNMVGQLENIGYCLTGHECSYNIQIIEERQTIIGLGGGAGTKLVTPGTWQLTSYYNPKDPDNYIQRIDELANRKVSLLNEFFAGIRSNIEK